MEGPFNLYNRYDSEKGTFEFGGKGDADESVSNFNPHVLGRLMQMLVRDMPTNKEMVYDSLHMSRYYTL